MYWQHKFYTLKVAHIFIAAIKTSAFVLLSTTSLLEFLALQILLTDSREEQGMH